MGDSGSGKSSAIRQILRQIAQRGDTAIVYDPALEFTPEFYSPERGDHILNPLDTRCPYWDIADEVSTAEVATTMAAALFPEKDHEKEFFTDAPRRIFARLMCRRPTPQQLVQWMSDPAEIARMVQGTPRASAWWTVPPTLSRRVSNIQVRRWRTSTIQMSCLSRCAMHTANSTGQLISAIGERHSILRCSGFCTFSNCIAHSMLRWRVCPEDDGLGADELPSICLSGNVLKSWTSAFSSGRGFDWGAEGCFRVVLSAF